MACGPIRRCPPILNFACSLTMCADTTLATWVLSLTKHTRTCRVLQSPLRILLVKLSTTSVCPTSVASVFRTSFSRTSAYFNCSLALLAPAPAPTQIIQDPSQTVPTVVAAHPRSILLRLKPTNRTIISAKSPRSPHSSRPSPSTTPTPILPPTNGRSTHQTSPFPIHTREARCSRLYPV